MNDLDLDQRLAAPSPEQLGSPDLTAIRSAGTRRRRGRVAGIAVGCALAVASVSGLGLTLLDDGGPGADRQTTVYTPPESPDQLSDLAKRVLDEVPGALQVSAGQVVIPGPDLGREMDSKIDPDLLAVAPVPLEAHTYIGVTAYPAKAFPAWLYDEVQRIEQEELGDEETGYPVGSTEMGILVETGNAELACLRPRASAGENMPGDRCFPTLVSEADGERTLRWSMGTEDFLEPGEEMELFTSDDYSHGSLSTVWMGGLDGTEVERVVFDLADGSTVDASVLPGTLVPGDTMFWANVEGEPTMVTAYDAAGAVIDDHKISACSGGVDCEVR